MRRRNIGSESEKERDEKQRERIFERISNDSSLMKAYRIQDDFWISNFLEPGRANSIDDVLSVVNDIFRKNKITAEHIPEDLKHFTAWDNTVKCISFEIEENTQWHKYIPVVEGISRISGTDQQKFILGSCIFTSEAYSYIAIGCMEFENPDEYDVVDTTFACSEYIQTAVEELGGTNTFINLDYAV